MQTSQNIELQLGTMNVYRTPIIESHGSTWSLIIGFEYMLKDGSNHTGKARIKLFYHPKDFLFVFLSFYS